ncbi:MAG TPA: hypothetical protein PK163_10030 [Steroidobacteraceae bacterium]|nr:hypothetical protein [Steroidobacteraceae bacterium]
MLPRNRWFVAAAPIHALLGSLLGLAWPGQLPGLALRAHGHLMLVGFGKQMLPRFTDAPIHVGRLAWMQQALVHAGIVLFAAGGAGGVRLILAAGGLLAWLGLVVFAARLWPVIARGGKLPRSADVARQQHAVLPAPSKTLAIQCCSRRASDFFLLSHLGNVSRLGLSERE